MQSVFYQRDPEELVVKRIARRLERFIVDLEKNANARENSTLTKRPARAHSDDGDTKILSLSEESPAAIAPPPPPKKEEIAPPPPPPPKKQEIAPPPPPPPKRQEIAPPPPPVAPRAAILKPQQKAHKPEEVKPREPAKDAKFEIELPAPDSAVDPLFSVETRVPPRNTPVITWIFVFILALVVASLAAFYLFRREFGL